MHEYSNNKMFLKNTIGEGNNLLTFSSQQKLTSTTLIHLTSHCPPKQIEFTPEKKSGIENGKRCQKPTQTRATLPYHLKVR